jgi:hypothetical protein
MGHARRATLADALSLAPKLRQEDIAEIRAVCGLPPREALIFCFFASPECYAIVAEEGVIGMFGVTREAHDTGAIWMVASDDLPRHGLEFLRKCRKWVDELNDRYPLLYNYADQRNTVHLKWLRWCGFQFINLEPYGVEQRPFYLFVRINPCAS